MEPASDASELSESASKDAAPNHSSTNVAAANNHVHNKKEVDINNDFLGGRTAVDLTEDRAITMSIIIPFSMIGALIRIGLNELFVYPGAPVFYLTYTQVVGCAIMGFCLGRRGFIMESYLPLYTGLVTGLCGSITTFSSWMLAVFTDLIGYTAYSRSGFYNVMASVADIGVTIGMSLVALKFGEHLADLIMPNQKAPVGLKYRITVKKSKIRDFLFLDWMCITGGLVSMIVAVILAGMIKVNRRVLFATLFAPFGTFTRWQLSRFNHLKSHFPFGTFCANILGSLILGMLFLLCNGIVHPGVGCEVMMGLMNGFCGCLTTVSTFIAEMSTLKRQYAYMYAITSVVTGQIGMILVVGIYDWTVGLTPTCH